MLMRILRISQTISCFYLYHITNFQTSHIKTLNI